MTARVRLVDEAVVELEDAARWYEEQRAGLGFGFVAAVDRTIDRMAHWPFSGSLIDGVDEVLQVRRLPVKRFPYYVAYLSGPEDLTVLAVAHERRRPLYWGGRVG